MTIAIAIKTATAVVFAVDSKVTTSGIVGIEEDGSPRWVDQTYDNAVKVVHDRSKMVMAMVAGHANVGQMAAADFIASRDLFPPVGLSPRQHQERVIQEVLAEMVELKREYWASTKVAPEEWPGPTLLLGAPCAGERAPTVWYVNMQGPEFQMEEILHEPGIRLEGAYDEVFGLLYGFEPSVLNGLVDVIGADREMVREKFSADLKVLRPIDKMNLWAMPIQDAIDLAVFLANVQVQMDRFLPGPAVCGGPIDVMVLQMSPEPGILSSPGKALRHPNQLG